MKIGIVADTHSRELPKPMLKGLKEVDFIIHAGDFCDLNDYQKFARLKEVKAVYGNMDDADIRRKFPRKQIIPCGRFQIGLFHGEGPPHTILERVREEFSNDKVDAVVFGHSHQPFNEEVGGVLYFNPGSPCDDIFAPYFSYGMMEVSDKGISAKIIRIAG